ncbi:hypothetical protein A1OE_957 [Candidatus Endolissoclinum faulkneri L2]|uniref:Uncharacterized protein n=1 Tax=Candidatus Endolissoclinum faulkneri L2 TaxID=1193729 RepID=K7Z511_9PROT|nr:hypothetical protein A1OE_957 [Candidatus Endolissoclinum faulkneri L2]
MRLWANNLINVPNITHLQLLSLYFNIYQFFLIHLPYGPPDVDFFN